MTEHAAAEIAETICWVVGEIGQLLDADFPEFGPTEHVLELRRVPQTAMEPWTKFEKHRRCEATTSTAPPKFNVNQQLNDKIYIGSCDLLELEVGAIAVFLDEVAPYSSRIARRIQIQSGKEMPYAALERLRCGDVLLQKSYNIGSDYVVYAIAPRFSTRYPDASANILNMCVREALKAVIDAGVDTIAFPLKLSREVSYPDADFATTVLRAIRRWLELPAVAHKIAKVFLFGVDNHSYSLMRRYFPRDKVEERLSGEIPDAGNEYGEIVKVERNIRISAGLSSDAAGAESDSPADNAHISAPLANFSDNCRVGSDRQISATDRDFDYYSRLSLSIMGLPVYRQMDDSGFVTRHGRDVAKRPVIAIDASKMPEGLNQAHAIAYILRMMQPVIQNRFVMVLLNMDHSFVAASSLCTIVSQLFQVLGDKRLANLGVVYVHRCGWALRGVLYVVTSFLPDAVRESIVYLDSDAELEKYLDLPKQDTRD